MTLQRTDRDWSMLKNEYNICKMKLDSKREGLKILMKDLEQCQIERDIYKNKVCQLQQELDELKELLGGNYRKKNGSMFLCEESNDKKIKTLTQLVKHVREENQALHNDLASVKQLYAEAQRDNQLLRQTLGQHENRKKESNSETYDKMQLIEQLEEAQRKIEEAKTDIENFKDERLELLQERDQNKEKCKRLNSQLNYILHNDDRRLVDVDALVLENKYLKEVSKQCKEEKNMMVASVSRYKEAMDRRFNKANKLLSYLDVPRSFTQKAFGNQLSSRRDSCSETFHELQRLTKSLTESLTDKDTALKVQRKTNRVLGTRVRELEKKLKTLEISGLWSLQGQKYKDELSEIGTAHVQDETKQSDDITKSDDGKLSAASDVVPSEEELVFEETCWDPYCEKVQDVVKETGEEEVKKSEMLIDVNGTQEYKDCNENVSNGSYLKMHSRNITIETYRDDWNINMNYQHDIELNWRTLRRTASCPDTPCSFVSH